MGDDEFGDFGGLVFEGLGEGGVEGFLGFEIFFEIFDFFGHVLDFLGLVDAFSLDVISVFDCFF